jgi:hypothetical protein
MLTEKLKHILQEIEDIMLMFKSHIGELERVLMDGYKTDIIIFPPKPNHNLELEFNKCDNRLHFIFLAYAGFMYRAYGYKPVITGVGRTQIEQDSIYKNNPNYKKQKWISTHQTQPCRAIDFRSKDQTPEQIIITENFFKQIDYGTDKKTLLRHSVGGHGDHFHLQVSYHESTSILRIP